MSKQDYMKLTDEYDLDRFNSILTEDKMKFMTDYAEGIGLFPRSNLFTTSLIPFNDNSYNFFVYNFKRIEVDTESLGENYSNPNNIDYIPLFIQKFKPNAVLKLYFKKPKDEARIRYEIFKRGNRSVINSGYIAYERRGVRDYDNSLIELQSSPMSKMYEPDESLLTTNKYLTRYPEMVDGKTYSNHFINLHKLIYDVRDATQPSEFNKIRHQFRTSDNYKFAFENLNHINKNILEPFQGEYYDLVKDGDEIKQVDIPEPENNEDFKGKNIIFDSDNCVEINKEFYISPGDYQINIILDKETEDDYKDGVLVSMEYNIEGALESNYKVITDRDNNPVHLQELKNFKDLNRTDLSFFIKSNILELISNLKNVGSFIKLNDGSTKVNSSKMNFIKPERFEPFIIINLFRILLKFRVGRLEEEGTYKYLISKLDKFFNSYLMGNLDLRTIDDQGSAKYKSLESQFIELTRKGNLTTPEEQQIFSLQQQMIDLKEEELERIHGPRQPNLRKIEELNLFSQDIYDVSDSVNKKKDIETEIEKMEEVNAFNEKMIHLQKEYYIENQITLSNIDSAVGKEIILETWNYDSDISKTRYVQMSNDGKDTVFGRKVYIKSKLHPGKYLSDKGNPQLSDTPHEWIISNQLPKNKWAEPVHNPNPQYRQKNFNGHSIKTVGGKHLLKGFDGVGYHFDKTKFFIDESHPAETQNHEKPGRFYLIRVGKNTYNIMNYFQTQTWWMKDWYKKNGGVEGNKNEVNWGLSVSSDGKNVESDFKTVNNPAMQWEITVVDQSDTKYQAYAFDNTITGKNVFKLLKNEDNSYSLEFDRKDKKMYVDYSKYTITLNENNTDNTKYKIHQGKAGNDYVEFRQKKNPSKPYKALFHYHGLGPRWRDRPDLVTNPGSELYNLAGPGAKILLDHFSRDGELAGDFSGGDPNNRDFYYNHDVFGKWLSFKIHIVKPVEEFTGSIEHFSEDPIVKFRSASERINSKKETKKEGLNLETDGQRQQRELQSSMPEISLDLKTFMKVYNYFSNDVKDRYEVLKTRLESNKLKLEDLKEAVSEESLEDLNRLKLKTKRDNMILIINSYVKEYLKDPNGASSVEIYYNNLMEKLENDKVNEEGLVSNLKKSSDTMNYRRPTYSTVDFSINIKKDAVLLIEKQEKDVELIKDEIVDVTDFDDVDSFTLMVRSILTEIKKDFRLIIKKKNYKYLSPVLENLLRNLYNRSKNQVGENQRKVKQVINIILNLVNKVKDGSIDDINDLLDTNVNDYQFPNEILQENFSNYNTMNPNIIEHFDSDYHKHTADGRINFDLQWGNPLLKENEGRYDEYSLLNDVSKTNVMKSYDKMNNVLKKASNMVNNFAVGMEAKMNNYNSLKVEKSTDQAVNQLDNTIQDMSSANYEEKEQQQRIKLNRITDKVKELEKIQNKAYVGDSKEFNTIKSFGDGQILSIKNMKNDIYNVLLNGECLSYNKRNDVQILPCNSSKDQQFKLNNITDMNQYNNVITGNDQEPVGEFDGVSYPFSMVNPVLHKSQCLTLNGNSVGLKDCMNSNKQRWEGLKNIKLCDKL